MPNIPAVDRFHKLVDDISRFYPPSQKTMGFARWAPPWLDRLLF